jgi:hypothetical protein
MLENLENKHFTAWHGKKTKPEMPGPYQCRYPDRLGGFVEGYSIWTGTYWTKVKYTIEELEGVKKRAKVQAIKWRGLNEEGYRQLTKQIETEKAEKLHEENASLLEQIRVLEKKGRDELANAEVKYSLFLKQCKRDRQLAARAKIRFKTGDFESLRPSLTGDGYRVYVESPNASLEQANISLKEALLAANERLLHWGTVWFEVMGLADLVNPPTDVPVHESDYLTPKGMTVSYGDDMKSKIAKAAPPWAFHGSFGTKAK